MKQFATAFGISFAAMFPLLNPVGHAPMFYVFTRDVSADDRHRQALKTSQGKRHRRHQPHPRLPDPRDRH
jgi:hypothetical protein